MKFKMTMIVGIFILAIMTFNAVCAEDSCLNSTDIAEDTLQNQEGYVELVENEDYSINAPAEILDSTYYGSDIASVEFEPTDANGNISITVDELERYNEKVVSGPNAISLCELNLDYGNHSLKFKYSGDDKYARFMKNFTFEKIYLDVECPYEFALDGAEFTLDVNLAKGVSGNIKILIDNKIVYNSKYDVNNAPSISLNRYIGYHTYEVRYSNGNQKDLIKKGSFNGSIFYEPFFDVYYGDTVSYGDAVEFELMLPEESYGTAMVNGKKYTFEYDYDYYITYLSIDAFEVGENIVEFTVYCGDDSQTRTCSVFVPPKLTVPTAMLSDENYTLTFNGSNNLEGDLILTGMINDTFKLINGTVTVPISSNEIGTHQLNVRFENYTWNYTVSVLEESPEVFIEFIYYDEIYPWYIDSDLDPDHESFLYFINVHAKPYELKGDTEIYLDDKLVDTMSGEFFEHHLWPDYYDFGKHTIKVVYLGDKTFKSMNKTYNYTVTHHYCEIDETGTVNVRIVGDAAGVLTVECGEKTYTKKIKATDNPSEYYSISLENLKKGVNYTVNVDFKGNSDKYSFSKTLNFTVTCPIYIENNHYTYGDGSILVFYAPKDIENKAEVIIDGKSYDCHKIDYDDELVFDEETQNAYKVNIGGLRPGNHEVIISYAGDSKYPSNSINKTINIETEFVWMSDNTLSLDLPDNCKGNLIIEIRHEYEENYKIFKNVSLTGGNAKIQLPVGKYQYKAYYTGNDYYVDEYEGYESIYPNLNYCTDMNYGQNFNLKVNEDMNGTVIFYIGWDKCFRLPVATFDLSQGKVISIDKKLIDNALKHKMAKCIIENNYANDEYYSLDLNAIISSDIGKFDLDTIHINFAAKVTGASNINMQYSDSKTMSLKVYDIYGKLVGKNQVVKIKIGKKTFSAKTDKNGAVKFKIPNTITPGKYTVKITYKNVKITKKLTVKQVLTLKTAKVKKSAKKLVLTATLKKGKKAIKNKKITFKFNGKTYKAKTNSKGIAKVTIKKSVLKKLKVGKKITYQATYLKDTVKKTAKILK